MLLLLFGSLFILLFLSVPIFGCLAISASLVFSQYFSTFNYGSLLGQSMVTCMDSFPLLAIPFFMLVGTLMIKSNIANHLVDVARVFTGDTPGGLGMAATLAAMLFAAISGSAPATCAAIGAIMIPAMCEEGYSKDYSGSLIASASTIGPVIPPSIPMIMFGVTCSVSVIKLFMGGIVPGILMGVACMAYNFYLSKKRGWRGKPNRMTRHEKLSVIWKGTPALLMPIIILGGIYAGLFTPTESAVVGVVYALLVGVFVYHTLTPRLIADALKEAAISGGTIMILFGGASIFSKLLTLGSVPQQVSALMANLNSKFIIMLVINIVFLICGMFIDTTSSIILFAPLFAPIVADLGYDLTFFGVMITVNLCIGMITPPLGGNLFIAQKITGTPLESILKGCVPFIVILLAVLALITIFPGIVMFLPSLLGS